MSPRKLAWAAAVTRVGLGAVIAAYPRSAAMWAGEGVEEPPGAMVARGLGVRDLLLGLGQLQALAGSRELQPWLAYGAVADVADVVATAVAMRDLPRSARVLLPAIVAATIVDIYVATRPATDLE